MNNRLSSLGRGYTDDTSILGEIHDLISEANVLAGRWALTDEAKAEREAFRVRKQELLERLNLATSPVYVAVDRIEGRWQR